MDLQKLSFIEPGESCPHLLKIALWKELGRLVQKYRIAKKFLISYSDFISNMRVTDQRHYDR